MAADHSEFIASLPKEVREACQPLFDVLPPDKAMEELVPESYLMEASTVAADVVRREPIANSEGLQALIWLYVDELEKSHLVSQNMSTKTGSYLHGIMHRREGDFSNAKYWFRNAGEHPAAPFDPHEFVDQASRLYRDNPESLVEKQRVEWEALFKHIADEL
ncbi:MAG: hypothetical protein ACOCX1_03570 [Fimbriimonadaceae bacterium]